MGALDLPLQALASSLIGALGYSGAQLVRTSGVNYDVKSGNDLPSGVTSYTITVSPPESFKKQEIDGTVVLKSDLKCYVAAKDIPVVPNPRTDTLTLGSIVYNIVRVEPIYSGSLVCLYGIHLRI
jgi:hypothetical protein